VCVCVYMCSLIIRIWNLSTVSTESTEKYPMNNWWEMDKPLLVHVLFNPARYICCSFALLLVVRYMYPESFLPGMKADRADLYSLCMWNSMLACGVVLYHLLSLIFFGKMSRDVASVVLQKVLNYVTSKLVLVEIICKAGITSTTRWVVWFIVISICKGLMAHGVIHVEGLSSAGRSWHYYLRPFGHLLCVTGGVLLLYRLKHAASIDLAALNISTRVLLSYDIVLIISDLFRSFMIFIVNLMDTLHLLPHFISPNEFGYLVDLIISLSELGVKFFHLVHTLAANGMSLSLVDIAIMLNSRSCLFEIIEKMREISNFNRIKTNLQTNFETVFGPAFKYYYDDEIDVNRCDSLASEVCPICLQNFVAIGKMLPCGHLIHEDCLRTMIQKQSEVYPGPPLTEDMLAEAIEAAASRSSFLGGGCRGGGGVASTVSSDISSTSHRLPSQQDSQTSVAYTASTDELPPHSNQPDDTSRALTKPLHFIKCPMCRKNVDVVWGLPLPDFDTKAPTPGSSPTPAAPAPGMSDGSCYTARTYIFSINCFRQVWTQWP
jgi:hypothetical protein